MWPIALFQNWWRVFAAKFAFKISQQWNRQRGIRDLFLSRGNRGGRQKEPQSFPRFIAPNQPPASEIWIQPVSPPHPHHRCSPLLHRSSAMASTRDLAIASISAAAGAVAAAAALRFLSRCRTSSVRPQNMSLAANGSAPERPLGQSPFDPAKREGFVPAVLPSLVVRSWVQLLLSILCGFMAFVFAGISPGTTTSWRSPSFRLSGPRILTGR